jgi:hypothetical protein
MRNILRRPSRSTLSAPATVATRKSVAMTVEPYWAHAAGTWLPLRKCVDESMIAERENVFTDTA